jgi:hypothetical protein
MSRLKKLVRPPSDAGGLARLRVGLVLLGMLVIVAFAASTAYDAWRSHQRAIVSANRELENLAGVVAEQTAWSWQWSESLLEEVARWYPEHAAMAPERIDQFLASHAAGVPQLHSIRIIDAQGILRYSSSNLDRRGVDVSDRSYFRAQQDHAVAGLFVSEPLLTRSAGRTAVLLSRRLEDGQHGFSGVVSASIDVGDLSRLYAAVNLRGKIAIQLLREDGTLLGRSPPEAALIGRAYPALVAPGPEAASGIRSPLDGEREFLAVARVPSMPLIVAATRNAAVAMAPAYQEAIHGAVRTLVLVLLAALTVAALMRQLRRIEQGDRALRQSHTISTIFSAPSSATASWHSNRRPRAARYAATSITSCMPPAARVRWSIASSGSVAPVLPSASRSASRPWSRKRSSCCRPLSRRIFSCRSSSRPATRRSSATRRGSIR